MENKKYKIEYLELFNDDLLGVVSYITYSLNNRKAANDLIDLVEKAIKERSKYPLSFEPYKTSHKHKHKYYRINVKNYSIFYVVIGDVMEVRRFLYGGSDIDNLL